MDRLSFLLEKLRAKECSPKELVELKALMSEQDGQYFERYLEEDLKTIIPENTAERGERLWNTISASIEARKPSTSPSLSMQIRRWSVAALILLLLSAGGYKLFWSNSGGSVEEILVENKKQEVLKVQLPDETTVWLNIKSRLRYPAAFDNRERRVVLEGQAFFDVVREEKRPFIVKTDKLITEVLGTTFDIKTYEHSEKVDVALFTGLVELKVEQNEKKWKLVPNQQFTLSEDGSVTINAFKPEFKAAWRTGELKFSEHTMKDVLAVLQQYFPAKKIELTAPSLSEASISGTFRLTDGLENILELICFNKGWTFRKTEQNYFEITE